MVTAGRRERALCPSGHVDESKLSDNKLDVFTVLPQVAVNQQISTPHHESKIA